MGKHPFDPIALLFGGIFLVAGIIAVAGGSIIDDGRFLLPVSLIGLGLAVMHQTRGRNRENEALQASAGENSPGHEVGAESGEDG